MLTVLKARAEEEGGGRGQGSGGFTGLAPLMPRGTSQQRTHWDHESAVSLGGGPAEAPAPTACPHALSLSLIHHTAHLKPRKLGLRDIG